MNNLYKLVAAVIIIGISLCGFKLLANIIAAILSAAAFTIGVILLINAVKSFARDYMNNK